ncbi:MAG: glycerate kinase [Actinomycetota bacterium]
MQVLVAPDKFRGTLTAAQAAEAIATGWQRTRPDDRVVRVPMADGGEGTLDALVAAGKGEIDSATVSGPLGDPVTAEFGIVPTAQGRSVVIEMARASGLELVSEGRRDPLRATTYGTGELMRTAIERYAPTSMLVCIGGSATTDGGAGMARALGARLPKADGTPIEPGGLGLLDLATIDLGELPRVTGAIRFDVASDVDNPLVGPTGAAAVYGPQKGATPENIALLDRALGHFAAIFGRDLGIDLRDSPGAGAAGGLGAGLMGFLGARLRPGVEVVMDAVGFAERLGDADLVITGEGRFDASSMRGKTVGGVLTTARLSKVPVVVVCGRADMQVPDIRVRSLVERFGLPRAMEDTRRALQDLAAEMAADPVDPAGV